MTRSRASRRFLSSTITSSKGLRRAPHHDATGSYPVIELHGMLTLPWSPARSWQPLRCQTGPRRVGYAYKVVDTPICLLPLPGRIKE